MEEIAMVDYRRSIKAITMGILRKDGNTTTSSSQDNNNNKNNDSNNNNHKNKNNGHHNNKNNNNSKKNNNNNNNDGNKNNNNNNSEGKNNSRKNVDDNDNNDDDSRSTVAMGSGSKGGSEKLGSNKAVKGDDDSLNVPLLAGIVAAIGMFILLITIVCVVCCCKKKRNKKDSRLFDPPQYPPHQPPYSGPYPPWPSPQDMNIYSGGPPAMSSNLYGGPPGMPMPPPPPPPPMMGTEDMSSGSYSSGPTGPALPPPHPSMVLGFNKSTFTYDDLANATNGFSQGNLLGQGGFGFVHKGVLPNGKEIAVKSLKSGSGQGEREFQAEVEIISRVHHRYLVSLVGYCIAAGQRMLVYEFVPNGTLDYHLHGRGRPVMDFPTRMKIGIGSAKGLAYLHEDCHPRIIHRDIKSANILLDYNFEAQVADFGLAKLSLDNYTHVSTRVMGTFGYLAPEYAASGKLTDKSDVFSFGVMLLELVTGKRPIDPDAEEDSLVDWARPLIGRAMDEGVYNGLVDPKLEGHFDTQEMLRLVACAGASIRHSAKRRPKMSQIVRVLEGDVSLDDLNGATKQAIAPQVSSSGGSDYDTHSYQGDMERLRNAANDNSDYSNNEYGHNSSDESGLKKSIPNSREFL